MLKKNAEHVHPMKWMGGLSKDCDTPVLVIVTWWEPEQDSASFLFENGPEALEQIQSPEFNQQFMSELDDEWEIHDDVTFRVIPF